MKCKILSRILVVGTLVLVLVSVVDEAQAQRNGKIKFFRRFQRHRTQSAGRSESASNGRGLFKHLMMFKNMWQQPSSNVIIITRPTTTTDTTTQTNSPTGTATRAIPKQAAKKEKYEDDDTDVDVEDEDDIEILETNAQNNVKGVNDKLSIENVYKSESKQRERSSNQRHKKRRNPANHHKKRRKQVIDIDEILKREEERQKSRNDSNKRESATNPNEDSASNKSGSFMRLINSLRLQTTNH